jgi:hypothetical protein
LVIQAKQEKLNSKRDFKRKDAEIKLTKFAKSVEIRRSELNDKLTENTKLEEKNAILRAELAVREQVARRNNSASSNTKTSSKMKKVVARRQLVDAAQAQAEEVEYLKGELEKLRQKTFPSFVRATRSRLSYNPDERI